MGTFSWIPRLHFSVFYKISIDNVMENVANCYKTWIDFCLRLSRWIIQLCSDIRVCSTKRELGPRFSNQKKPHVSPNWGKVIKRFICCGLSVHYSHFPQTCTADLLRMCLHSLKTYLIESSSSSSTFWADEAINVSPRFTYKEWKHSSPLSRERVRF